MSIFNFSSFKNFQFLYKIKYFLQKSFKLLVLESILKINLSLFKKWYFLCAIIKSTFLKVLITLNVLRIEL